jgi:hypothetical protein
VQSVKVGGEQGVADCAKEESWIGARVGEGTPVRERLLSWCILQESRRHVLARSVGQSTTIGRDDTNKRAKLAVRGGSGN